MCLLPIKKMWERVELAKQDSDTALFLHLLYAGEMILKLIVSGMASLISDDRERHKYRLLHMLVRADGLGDWTKALDELLIGPTSQYLSVESKDLQQELTQKFVRGSWQYDSVDLIYNVLSSVHTQDESLSTKVSLRQFFALFVTLRNKTRGHGAIKTSTCSKHSTQLENALLLLINNLSLFKKTWVYLHRNLSGKYRVVQLGGDASCLDYLKSSSFSKSPSSMHFKDGVYIAVEPSSPFNSSKSRLYRVDLVFSNVDAIDFFFPNGSFNDSKKNFEIISYITDNRVFYDSTPFMTPANDIPPSETDGLRSLDIIGTAFSNLPPRPNEYVSRTDLERDLESVLCDDRHPVLTLVGRGGIGKTSLALAVLHKISLNNHFEAILWFSARDIDLLPEGPKTVTPRVLSHKDIADEFVELTGPIEKSNKGFDSLDYFSKSLSKSPTGKPFLFVFDNFETVNRPNDLFAYLDTNIRLPNKILITTRQREFKADYPIEVSGMTNAEASMLISNVSSRLNIQSLLTAEYKEQVYHEADGHPYIIKVLLGEVSKARKLVKVERLIATKDDMLDALFERTFAGLSPSSKRVFLTLCRWRSLVPQVALEAVLLRPSNEKIEVDAAIDELIRSSFIESLEGEDKSLFISVPLVASVFGQRKIEVSPMKPAVEADVELLQVIGATQASGLKHGIAPRIEKLFQHVAKEAIKNHTNLHQYIPILEFVCRNYSPGWLMLASLYEEIGTTESLDKAKDAIRSLIERTTDTELQKNGWDELARLCQMTNDWSGEALSLLGLCKLPNTPFSIISNAANRLNGLLRQNYHMLDSDEKRIVILDLISLMEKRSGEADATDLSRLAWLCLHVHDEDRAKKFIKIGLEHEYSNEHCLKLAKRLNVY